MPSGDARLVVHPLVAAALLPASRANAAFGAWQNAASNEPLDPALWRILPLLHARLAGAEADLETPTSPAGEALAVKARAAFEQTRYRNALLLAEATEALRALRGAGLETCLLKGAALVAAFYRDQGLRPMSDADILVRSDDAPRAIEVLLAGGWHTPRRLGPSEIARFHSAPFTSVAHGSIDLHWRALDARFEEGDDESLWAASGFGEIAGEACRVPAAADLLLHACVGGQRFEGEASWRWLADARAILARTDAALDWGRFETEAMRCGESETVADALGELRATLDVSVPFGLTDRLRGARMTVSRRLAARARRLAPDSRGLVPTLALHLETYRDLAARGAVPAGPRGFARSVAFAWGDIDVRDLPREVVSRGARRLGAALGLRPLRRFLRYPRDERRTVSFALALLVLSRVTLRFSTVSRARRLVARFAPAVSSPPPRVAELTTVAAHQLPGATTCLPRAIVLEALLRASGRPAELKIGIAAIPAEGRPDTHAWVEVDGVSLDETARVYTPLPLFGTRG